MIPPLVFTLIEIVILLDFNHQSSSIFMEVRHENVLKLCSAFMPRNPAQGATGEWYHPDFLETIGHMTSNSKFEEKQVQEERPE